MNLKHILSQIEPDRDNLRHDRSPLWILADPPWHIDAVGGGYIINAGLHARLSIVLPEMDYPRMISVARIQKYLAEHGK
jgi:hypothetical protein